MTDRLKGVVVTFEQNVREDDAEVLISAIRCIRGVSAVDSIPAGPGISDWLTRTDERRKLEQKVRDVFRAEEMFT